MTIRYAPVRQAGRKGARERITGHEWRCLDCNEIVHSEPLVGIEVEETEKQAAKRHARIERAKAKHKCRRKQ